MMPVVPVHIITFEGRPNNITIGLEAEAVKLYLAGCAKGSMVLEETLIEDGSSHASSRGCRELHYGSLVRLACGIQGKMLAVS
jgi:hypothetical protein